MAARLDTTPIRFADGRVEERPNGRDVMIPVSTNEQAAQASVAVRERLIEAGLVDPSQGEVELEGHGGTVAVGDHIACRENDRRLGVTNRRLYTVAEVHEWGGLDVASHVTGEIRRLTAEYVREHVSLGYAGTAHAVEGITVDASYPVTAGNIDAAGGYVMSTRGRETNTWFVAQRLPDEDKSRPEDAQVFQSAGRAMERVHELTKSKERPSGRAILEDVLQRGNESRDAAMVHLDRDDARIRSMSTIHGLREDAVREVCGVRTMGWVEELAQAGAIDEDTAKRIGVDQATEGLARLLRAVEQSGHDPQAMLRHAALDPRGFDGIHSVSSALSARISTTFEENVGVRPAAARPVTAEIPAGSSPAMVAHLERLREAAAERRRELGTQVAEEQPQWAVSALGPVPDEPTARLEWEHRAGVAAGYREARGWDDEQRAIDESPGISSTERRADWHEAYDALGRPETEREEAAMSTGRLLMRVRAYDAELRWAPADADGCA